MNDDKITETKLQSTRISRGLGFLFFSIFPSITFFRWPRLYFLFLWGMIKIFSKQTSDLYDCHHFSFSIVWNVNIFMRVIFWKLVQSPPLKFLCGSFASPLQFFPCQLIPALKSCPAKLVYSSIKHSDWSCLLWVESSFYVCALCKLVIACNRN